MVKCSVYIGYIVCAVFAAVDCVRVKEPCDSRCVLAESCQFFGNMRKDEQTNWLERFLCDDPRRGSGSSKLVCCPENVWNVDNSHYSPPQPNDDEVAIEKKSNFPFQQRYDGYNFNNYPNSQRGNNYGDSYGDRFGNRFGNQYGTQNRNGGSKGNRQRPDNTAQNPYFMAANQNRNAGNNGNSFNSQNQRGQCPVTSFPPNPDSGCCGIEASEDDSEAGGPMYNQQNNWMPQTNRRTSNWPSWMQYSDDDEEKRRKRDTENVGVTIDNRIAGGRETDLEQFPWTVLLKTTFSYPDKEASFSCGGSLISSRYVLTAGHCVFDQNGSVKGVEVFLAEYDKRTFPKDCKNVLGKGQVCIDNIVMEAESVHIHPQYDDDRLHNDIALIRLRGVAPYNNYVRPICLPPINVDSPDLSHLRLAVAGWGRNGAFKSNIKQSTVVNLIPNLECGESYPGITKNQLCAAGYSGEDTCKGDSGGPLMMVYGGKYYVSGVVSGKRADAPCGTSVPSLYTNVYEYKGWIQSVIRN